MNKLFEDFKPTTTQEWEDKIKIDLKGADYQKKLVTKTSEGININPYYRKEILEELSNVDTLPGQFPYLRGHQTKTNRWYVRQDILIKDIEKANEKALTILMKGVDSLGFDFSEFERDIKEEDIERITKNIFADTVEINYKGIQNPLTIATSFEHLAKKYNRNLEHIAGSIEYDPLGDSILTGTLDQDYLEIAKEMIKKTEHIPHFRTLLIQANNFHNAGANAFQEIAYALAQAVDYIHYLTDAGLSLRDIIPKINFHFAIGGHYFMEIAKFRAVRMLFAQITKAYGLTEPKCAKMNIHAETSLWNKTVYDPYVNLLRSSSESLSAILAGVDSLRILDFSVARGESSEFSERIARNQQLIMRHESYLDYVIDPAAGSYYIEFLTHELAEKAWSEFLRVQEKGGFVEAIKSSYIQEEIEAIAQEKQKDIAIAKIAFLGSNRFPNESETLDELTLQKLDTKKIDNTQAEIKILHLHRGAEPFEHLRMKVDAYSIHNERPKVYLLSYGNLTMRRARLMFAQSFFAVAGFQLIELPESKDLQKTLVKLPDETPSITVFCSSDQEYSKITKENLQILKGKSIPIVAGNPKAEKKYLESIGLKHFVHVRSNLLEVLSALVADLGI